METLLRYGAGPRQFQQAAQYPALTLARVISQSRELYRIVTEAGEGLAAVSGRFRHEAAAAEEYPAVGDYVLTQEEGESVVIQRLLPRKSVFLRKDPSKAHGAQVIAANIDLAFVCMSLNENFNLSRLERYVAAVWDSGATPVIVLTKADLCNDLPARLSQVTGAAPGTDTVVTDWEAPDALERVRAYLGPGITGTFIGSSGVGKSTLINRLAGAELLETNAVREDGKGRHTTTRRELIPLPGGGAVIDTPGMRALGVESVDLERSFNDIEALAEQCRFRDCAHAGEPGCAVAEAIRQGTLDARRLASYSKLKREAGYEGLSAKALEKEKLESMFSAVGGMKNVRRYIRQNDKRKGEE